MTTIANNQAASIEYGSAASPDADDPVVAGLRRSAWVKIGVVTLLFAAVFWPNLRRIFAKIDPIGGDPNWKHGLFVPLVGLYYLYINRDDLLKAAVRPSWVGLGILVGGLIVSMLSVWPIQNDFIWDFGMVVTLFGLVLLLCGWGVMRTAWFPILFLVCAIPWPGLFYSQLAGPLQELAAKVAVKTLQATGVDAVRAGTKILYEMKGGEWRTLNVEEACSGLKALMTFISLAAAIAFLTARPMWQRGVILLSAIPIAILCNVMRVAGQGLIDYYWNPEFSHGFAHGLTGLVMQIPAFFLLLTVVWLLEKIFVDEADERERAALAGAARAKLIIAARRPAAAAEAPGAKEEAATTQASATAEQPPALKLVRPPDSVPVPKAPPAPRTAAAPAPPTAPAAKPVNAAAKTTAAPAKAAAAPATAKTPAAPASKAPPTGTAKPAATAPSASVARRVPGVTPPPPANRPTQTGATKQPAPATEKSASPAAPARAAGPAPSAVRRPPVVVQPPVRADAPPPPSTQKPEGAA